MDLRALLSVPAVVRARALLHQRDPTTLAEQIELAQIPAPSLAEAARAVNVRDRFVKSGLERVHIDEAGNVLGWLATTGAADQSGAAPVVLAAHLDTVFPADTELSVYRTGSRIYAPGIADNARGLAALLALARALGESGIRITAPVLFAATVGEEGIGDLLGVKHLFREGSPFRAAKAFVSLDGPGIRRIVHRAVGSRRLRVRIYGSGGHSWADWGMPNPIATIGSIISETARLELPSSPKAVLSATRIGGGTAVNTIPSEAWVDLDLRSESSRDLARVEDRVREHVSRNVVAANRYRRSDTVPLRAEVILLGDRPGGATPALAPLVRIATEATRAVGARPVLAASSTDANVPMSLGVPAITLGAGGDGGGIHTRDEWYSNENGPSGIERALLTALTMANTRGD